MFQLTRSRTPRLLLSRSAGAVVSSVRHSTSNTTTDNPIATNNPKPTTDNSPTVTSTSTQLPTSSIGSHDEALVETAEEAEKMRTMQAPNRKAVWSRSQQSREKAMTGPRFEQILMRDQPRPWSAMELIHQQPVRWIKGHQATCDGGGGPLGHPRIFINVDKPQICMCTYCGVPFANEHHREVLEAQSFNTYPLDPQGDDAEVGTSQRVSDEAMTHR